jgi:nitrite reductase/ring-hydroxylating ferredoxin subunit
LLGLTTDIPNDNDWIRCSLAGTSVFVQRFGTTIRGFENVCRHRFHPLRTKAKGTGLVRCDFHHWVYNQEGEAVGIPQCKKLFGVSPRELGVKLREVELATCGFLIFGRFAGPICTGSGTDGSGAAKAVGAGESLETYLGEYPFRGQDELPCHFTPERSSLNRQRRRAALSAELSDQAAVMASPHLGDGRSRPAQGTARHRGPVA